MLVFTLRQKEVFPLCQLQFRALRGCTALQCHCWGCCHILQNCRVCWSKCLYPHKLQRTAHRNFEKGYLNAPGHSPEPPCPFVWSGNLGLHSESPAQSSLEARNAKAALVCCAMWASSFFFCMLWLLKANYSGEKKAIQMQIHQFPCSNWLIQSWLGYLHSLSHTTLIQFCFQTAKCKRQLHGELLPCVRLFKI